MPATIEAHGLTKQYGKTTALDGLDLVADQGRVTAVLGPNGAGKTTFIRMVATLLRADKGTLLVAGHDAGKDPRAVRRVIGLAGQFAAVEPAMTGRENLEMIAGLFGQNRRAAKGSAAAVLEQLGLVEAGDRLARTYSGGMRRGWILARVWSERRGCCCSTSPRRASIPVAGSSCGTRSARSCSQGPTSC